MKKLLLIEDNEDLLETIFEILELNGFEVLIANNGKTGLELALAYPPDLILCDIMMPKMDGFEVLKALRSNATTTMIPFIFLTAKAQKMDQLVGAAAGADLYLTKPFTMEQLLKTIEKCVTKE